MPKKEPNNCWEFWNCAPDLKKKCPAYKYTSGRDCWLAASSFREPGCPKVKNKFENCSECPWFKKINQGL